MEKKSSENDQSTENWPVQSFFFLISPEKKQ